MRILHFAYEDPRQPGSGGGSVRTREINRRLSERHTVTAIVSAYPEARERVEDGVRWVPIGTHTGTKLDRLSYFALLAKELQRPHDLVVEDFGAPFSIGFAPLFTRQPVVASVQWLFAKEMRQKYGLPFDTVERFGLRYYRRFIVVSNWLGQEVQRRRPRAAVVTIPNGVDDIAWSMPTLPPAHLLFVGRLDTAQKGCDLLLTAMARLRQALTQETPPLLIVGDGPDRADLERRTAALGLRGLVQFLGRVEGAEKYRLMANAHAVLMPSRFETFGMVAAEAQASGAPVITFDVGPLAEVAGGGGARLLPPFDTQAFADATCAIVRDPALRTRLGVEGRAWACRYRWNDLALAQEQFYLNAVADVTSPALRQAGGFSHRAAEQGMQTGNEPQCAPKHRLGHHHV